MVPFFINVWRTWRYAPDVGVDDPWGWGASLEWATSCPPPRHNFVRLPRIRSERPAFDLHHPELIGHPHAPAAVGCWHVWVCVGSRFDGPLVGGT